MPAANKSAAEQCGFRGSDRLLVLLEMETKLV